MVNPSHGRQGETTKPTESEDEEELESKFDNSEYDYDILFVYANVIKMNSNGEEYPAKLAINDEIDSMYVLLKYIFQ